MQRSSTIKRCLVGTAAALALAAATPSFAAAATPMVPGPVTLDFTAHSPNTSEEGKDFGGLASVTDSATHQQIGGAVVMCTEVGGELGDVFGCSGELVLESPANQVLGHIAFQAGTLVYKSGSDQPDFDGVITGGTGAFEGLTGQIHFVRDSNKVYEATFMSAG